MAEVKMQSIYKQFGNTEVIHGVNLEVDDNEFVVLVGPSGCGKSTLLRLIAGLEDVTSGEIEIDGVRVDYLPPAKRGIAMVFQSYALYPHMNVYQNMSFGLRLAKTHGRNESIMFPFPKKCSHVVAIKSEIVRGVNDGNARILDITIQSPGF